MSQNPGGAQAKAPRPRRRSAARGQVQMASVPAPGSTTTAAPLAAAAPPGPAPAVGRTKGAPGAGRPSPIAAWARRTFEGTPGRMRLLGGLAALAAALFGIVGAMSMWSNAGAIERAGANTAQVVRVQAIYSDILRADADATNAFLVGGLEDSAQRADYEAAMSRVAQNIAEAAKAQPADGTALAELNTQVQAYVGSIEAARAYNRQGLPIGAQYLRTASTTLRGKALPVLEAMTQANTERAQQEFAAAGSVLPLVGAGVVGLLALGGVGYWLARRTHRTFNVPLTAGALIVLVAFVVGLVVVAGLSSDLGRVRDNQFAGTLALTTARSAAYDARSNESLGLIAQGQAQPYEQAWKARDKQVADAIVSLRGKVWYGGGGQSAAGVSTLWGAYESAHTKVRGLDDSGDWAGAVALATGIEAQGPRATFGSFDDAVAKAVDGFQRATAVDTTSPRGRAVVTSLILLLAGLVSALLVMRGIRARVEEYR